ncbi:hypothetical protein SKA53_09489 [Yoonia vestfoldensis SKA53]|uniref:Uncharacterized protein n=1 Tax=Yoonia vestfoldensis SKA53 TaxID=314232 RepID=A3V1J4_9RHOB|nr:hypothetical protein SKA53_09489 [Yoonia vestfoldensis SKA53]
MRMPQTDSGGSAVVPSLVYATVNNCDLPAGDLCQGVAGNTTAGAADRWQIGAWQMHL